ncbi:MAG: cryptochrome/photolyase family protein [Gemmatimonadetes bacterium]|nr:cryptochrome/photolyase family protein [Gemmatimonadota bacterium]
MRTLLLILGDQLDDGADALEALDPERDAVWMAEVDHEITAVPSHKRRIALFLAAMRHFRDRLGERGLSVHYHALGPDPADDRGPDFATVLATDLERLAPAEIVVTHPGDHRVLESLRRVAGEAEIPITVAPDRHFLCELDAFDGWIEGRKRILLEDFYRWMRKRLGVLIDEHGKPEGGRWNYDADNRESFGVDGPGDLPRPPRFEPDATTREVLDLVGRRWRDHPGDLEGFAEAVTPEQAQQALEHFVRDRLPRFGTYQDALWTGEHELFHSRLSAALNLKLLDPRACIGAAIDAWADGHAPLNAVEGFVRQILGWREYVRGIYWHYMPDYADGNALDCSDRDVPSFFWDGDTDMACVADAMEGVVRLGYAHHIQRLMVLGLFAQLAGVHPYRFHLWHMALYLDAVDWVSLPNTLGMSQFGDGGIVGTKPYCASGKYLRRQGAPCDGCRYDPDVATGADACPFTTLYWDFLMRHRDRLEEIPRMGFQLRNVDRKSEDERSALRDHAASLLDTLDGGGRL